MVGNVAKTDPVGSQTRYKLFLSGDLKTEIVFKLLEISNRFVGILASSFFEPGSGVSFFDEELKISLNLRVVTSAEMGKIGGFEKSFVYKLAVKNPSTNVDFFFRNFPNIISGWKPSSELLKARFTRFVTDPGFNLKLCLSGSSQIYDFSTINISKSGLYICSVQNNKLLFGEGSPVEIYFDAPQKNLRASIKCHAKIIRMEEIRDNAGAMKSAFGVVITKFVGEGKQLWEDLVDSIEQDILALFVNNERE
ncbi:MAG: hypothetical protein HQK54_10095 [Oligoflexales bacterium]|nr:hypothetical protein [Oligoflexales bacterium]